MRHTVAGAGLIVAVGAAALTLKLAGIEIGSDTQVAMIVTGVIGLASMGFGAFLDLVRN